MILGLERMWENRNSHAMCMYLNWCDIFRWEISNNHQDVKHTHFSLVPGQNGYIPTRKQQNIYKGIYCSLVCNF